MSEQPPPTPIGIPARVTDAACRLPRDPRSVGRARAVLRQQLAACRISGEVADSAELVLSELVTNAYRHACAPGRQIGVRISIQGGALTVEVSDADPTHPRAGGAADDDICGRGLFLVDALADDWGVQPRPFGIGKTVWAVIKLPEPPGDTA